MEELKKEHEELSKEVRHLKKIAAAMQLSHRLRRAYAKPHQTPEDISLLLKASHCIDSLLREIERCKK